MAEVAYDDERCPQRRGRFGVALRHEREGDKCHFCGQALERRVLTHLSQEEWNRLNFLLWEIDQGKRKQ